MKKFLIDQKLLKEIIKFDSKLNLFEKVLTTSCIIIIQNNNNNNDKIKFSLNKNYDNQVQYNDLSYKDIDTKIKWNKYFNINKNSFKNLIPLKNIGKFKRGIATGANHYFQFNQSKVNQYKISQQCLIKCLCSLKDFNKFKIIDDQIINLLINENKNIYLFNGLNAKSSFDKKYILLGEEKEIHLKHITSKKNPWFKLEQRFEADIFISVFNREKIHIFLNQSNIQYLTSVHGLYLNNNFKIFKEIIYLYLNTNKAKENFLEEKREYGNNLIKFEPNDLNNSLVLDFNLINQEDLKKLNILTKKLNNDNYQEIFNQSNVIFNHYL